jgi:hypothetical protein
LPARNSLIHLPRGFNPITLREQRRKIHKKHVNKIKRVCNWLYAAAKWNQKRGEYVTAMLLLGQMTDFVEA